MAKNPRQKQKLLYIQKILLEKTDDTHGITVPEIIDELERYGIAAERKSIYDDLKTLESFGLDICKKKSKTVTYYIGNRDFEMPELKLLVDAVQSSKFITHKKSLELIKKVERLASTHDGKLLQRQVFVTNRVKTLNEKIYYNVDTLHSAISLSKSISFLYFEWCLDFSTTTKVIKTPRKNGELYKVFPLGLIWDDENYYLVGYDQETNIRKHYRVDKMDNIEIMKDNRNFTPPSEKFDAALYAKSIFGMFGGEPAHIKLKVNNTLIGVIADRFGSNVFISKADDDHFFVDVKLELSPQFYGWLCGIGTEIQLVSPKSAVESFKEYIQKICSIYQ